MAAIPRELRGAQFGSLAHMTQQIRQAFEALSRTDHALPAGETARLRVQDDFGRFRVWAENIGAQHGPQDQRSLEHRLRQTPELIEGIRELLQELYETLEEVWIASQNLESTDTVALDSDDDGSEPRSAQASNTELEELSLIVGDVVTSLLKVSVLIRKATVRDRYARAAAARKEYPFDPAFDIRHVRDLYPNVAARPWLATRLGTAITRRRQFLRYSLEHRERLAAEDSVVVNPALERAATETQVFGTASQHQSVTAEQSSGLTVARTTTIAETTATTANADAAAGIDFRNLHLTTEDDAVSGTTSFASTASADVDQLRVVRLDSLTKNGSPFECPYCRGIVLFGRQEAWKRHVFHDLRAYVCTFEECTAGLFQSRTAWFDHEMTLHRRSWLCMSCNGESFCTMDGLKKHFAKLHASDSVQVDDLALDAMATASSRPVDLIATDSCPLCDELVLPAGDQKQGQGPNTSADAKLTVPAFRKHLAGHLEQLALSAIPVSFEGQVKSSEDSESSSACTDAQPQPEQDSLPSASQAPNDYHSLQYLQGTISRYYKNYHAGAIVFEGGCPGPWTYALAQRVMHKWKPSNTEDAEVRLLEELDEMTGYQHDRMEVSAVGGLEQDVYWVSKEDLLLNGPTWRILNGLIGIESVKAAILTLASDFVFEKPPPPDGGLPVEKSRLFLGPPGVGKSAVAKLYGQILFDLQLLSTNEMVRSTPTDLIGRSVAESETLTAKLLNGTWGKVLLVDHAELLDPRRGDRSQPSDPKRQAVVDKLNAHIEVSHDEDRCVILSGRKDDVLRMLQHANPGLKRRYPESSAFVFDDYSEEELESLLVSKVAHRQLRMTTEARAVALLELRDTRSKPEFANAMSVDRLVNRAAQRNAADRLSRSLVLRSNDGLDILLPEDFVGSLY